MIRHKRTFLIAAAIIGLAVGVEESTKPDTNDNIDRVMTQEEEAVLEMMWELDKRGLNVNSYEGQRDVSPEGVQKEYRFRVTPKVMPGDTLTVTVRQNDTGGGRRFSFKK